MLPAWVVPAVAGEGQAIEWSSLAAALPGALEGAAVLLHTGWDRHWGTPRALRHPFLSVAAAAGLVELGAGLVGTDALNVDATEGGTTHAHAALLGADVLIVENLTGLRRARVRSLLPLRLRAAAARRRRRLTHPRLRVPRRCLTRPRTRHPQGAPLR